LDLFDNLGPYRHRPYRQRIVWRVVEHDGHVKSMQNTTANTQYALAA